MSALGRPQQARARLIEHLRGARQECGNCLAELRYMDRHRGRNLRRFELTLRARMAGQDIEHDTDTAPATYVRTYWVIAKDIKSARRMARELEPADAEIRFEPQSDAGEPMPEADRGVVERTRARALD